MEVNEKYYTRKEIAKILSVHPMTIYREIRKGKIKSIKVAGDYRIPESSFNDYVKNQKV